MCAGVLCWCAGVCWCAGCPKPEPILLGSQAAPDRTRAQKASQKQANLLLGPQTALLYFYEEIDLISQLVRTSVTEYDEEGVMGMFSIIQPILLPPLFGCSTRGQRGR